jgi:hypothetical protein
LPDGRERIVLVTDRRLGAHMPSWPQPAAAKAGSPEEAEYTLIEMRIDGKGAGEGKSSLAAGAGPGVVVDADAKTLALEGYATAPALLTLRPVQSQPEPSRGLR